MLFPGLGGWLGELVRRLFSSRGVPSPFFSLFFFGYYVGTTECVHFEEVEFQITGVSVTC